MGERGVEDTILEVFLSVGERWLSADDVWRKLRDSGKRIGRKNVSRLIEELVEEGLVLKGFWGRKYKISSTVGVSMEPPPPVFDAGGDGWVYRPETGDMVWESGRITFAFPTFVARSADKYDE